MGNRPVTELFTMGKPFFALLEGCAVVGLGFMALREKEFRLTVLKLAAVRTDIANSEEESARPELNLLTLFPCRGMCYNRPAVEQAVKQGGAVIRTAESGSASPQVEPKAPAQGSVAVSAHEDASRYCPVCSQRLESRRCKLVCAVCGYYMSCADYY